MSRFVHLFVDSLTEAIAAIRADERFGGPTSREEALLALLRGARAGGVPRKGNLASGMRYQVHGNGSLFYTSNGEVDIDIDIDTGRVVWDAWKAASFPGTSVSRKDVQRAAELFSAEAARVGVVEELRPGVFSMRSQRTPEL